MNPDEKLTTLKKAYADIILNTAKEAAARIMASETKSVRLQHELNTSKEQAVQMLLRLKQMSDSKIREAETNSTSKQKKIEELEAQLQEAEDIVKELRDELRSAHDELERVKKSHLIEKKLEAEDIVKEHRDELRGAHDELERVKKSHLIEKKPEAEDIVKELREELRGEHDELEQVKKRHFIEKKAQVTSSATVLMEKSALDQINEAYNTYQDDNDGIVEPNDIPIEENISNTGNENEGVNENNFLNITNSYVSKPKLPSIILGRKGTEPYKNKRTQRIRAFEEKLMAGELAFSDTINEIKNNEKIKKKSGRGGGRKRDFVPAVQKVESLKRKRNKKNKKNLIFSSGHEQDLDSDRISDISHEELTLENKDDDNVDENPLDLLSRLSEDILKKCTKVSESEVFPETSGSADVADCEPSKQPATFKYTFQRRKKLGLSNSGTNAGVENEIVKDVEMEKGDVVAETGNSASVAESARDSRRMAQMARQLIALSEKKW